MQRKLGLSPFPLCILHSCMHTHIHVSYLFFLMPLGLTVTPAGHSTEEFPLPVCLDLCSDILQCEGEPRPKAAPVTCLWLTICPVLWECHSCSPGLFHLWNEPSTNHRNISHSEATVQACKRTVSLCLFKEASAADLQGLGLNSSTWVKLDGNFSQTLRVTQKSDWRKHVL